jgi:hypothetical protein
LIALEKLVDICLAVSRIYHRSSYILESIDRKFNLNHNLIENSHIQHFNPRTIIMSAKPAKRLRVQPKQSMDPFRMLFDVHELIYQHFSLADIMNVSQVAKQWNRNAGNSSACMRKIYLKFEPTTVNEPTPEAVGAILKSDRKYRKLKFDCRYPSLEVLEKFAGTVEVLKLEGISYEYTMGEVKFPKLKSLKIGEDIPSRVVDKIFGGVEHGNIKKLSIFCEFTPSIANFLKNYHGIIDLMLNKHLHPMFDSANIETLKLSKAILWFNFYRNIDEVKKNNIKKFLKSQEPSLVHVEHFPFLSAPDQLEMLIAIMNLSNLKVIELNTLLQSSINFASIPISTSIEAVRLNTLQPKPLLEKMPNLKILLWDFSYEEEAEEVIEMIVTTCMNLKKLYFIKDEDEDEMEIHAAYEELKLDDELEMNREIEFILVDDDFKLKVSMVQA